jgi:hypothetical protein
VECFKCGSEMYPPWHKSDEQLFALVCLKCGWYVAKKRQGARGEAGPP